MKRNLREKIVLTMTITAFTFGGYAQTTDKNVKEKITNEKGIPTQITFNNQSTYRSSEARQIFKTQLGLKDNSEFSKVKSETDKLGLSHEKYQLFHQGIKVEFATYTLHSKNGKLESMNGEFYTLDKVNTSPKLTKEQAFDRAKQQIGAKEYLWDSPKNAAEINYQKPTGELVILPILDNNTLRLAYKYDIYATNPVSRGDMYIDAITGEALFYNATIKHLGEFSHGKTKSKTLDSSLISAAKTTIVAANAATRYSGTQSIQTALSGSSYILSDATRGNGIQTYNMKKGTNYSTAVNFTDANNDWTAAEFNNTNKDNGALDAHWGAEKTYDYWSTVHARNSYDNAGATIKSYVHFDNAYDNAYWNGSVMTYGDGSGTYFDILTSIDVAGHEIGHAVCSNTANLAYQKESGAMNEAFSDIWGACIEYYAAPTKSIWLIGEDIERRAGHLSLRSMNNPKSEGQPDTYGGTNWKTINCGTPTQANDYCGVHTNSGVLNHWFYILSVGKSGTNDIGSTYNVTGITMDKAAKIAYRLESVYLSANSTFANARTYGIQSATDLYGAGSPEVIATTNAFYAVGVGAAYPGGTDTTAPTAPTNLVASGTTATTTNLSWTAATDNVAVTGYNVYKGTTLVTTITGLSYTVPGLTASTAYTFSVKAKDAAGNVSAASNVVSITTSAGTTDTTAPTAPTALAASGTTTTTTNLSWTASTDNVAVTGYNVYQGATLKATVTGTTYAVTGLTAATTYTFYVIAKDAAGNSSAASNTLSVTTSSTNITYCTSKGNTVTDEYIDYVGIGGIANTTAANAGYGNFTNLTGNVPYGSNTISYSAGFTGSAYTEVWAIWIDYNKNGTFETSEKVVTRSSSSSAILSSTFTVPTTALAGTTRMRVAMKYNAASTACETFTYGEVEDYTVNIGGTAFDSGVNTIVATSEEIENETNIYDFSMYPNPSTHSLNVRMADDRKATFGIFNTLGQEVSKGNLSANSIDISKLATGIYVIEINDGQKTITKKFIKK